MLTQRRPEESICSTLGACGSACGVAAASVSRRPARRSRGFGRFGIVRAHRLVYGQGHCHVQVKRPQPEASTIAVSVTIVAIVRHTEAPHLEGWRDWTLDTADT